MLFALALVLSTCVRTQDARNIVVHVLDARTKQPVAGAEVRWFIALDPFADESAAYERSDAIYSEGTVDEVGALERRCKSSATSSANGTVAIPCEAGALRLIASKGDLFGTSGGFRAYPCEYPDSIEVELWPDCDIEVMVADSTGAATAGISVVLRRQDRQDRDWARNLRESTTDTSGHVRLRHAGYLVGEESEWELTLPDNLRPEYFVGFGRCLRTPAPLVIDPTHLPRDLVRLELPPSGSIDVQVTNEDGTPVDIQLALVPEAPFGPIERDPFRDESVVALRTQPPPDRKIAMSGQGRARFDHVGLGQKLVLLGRRNPASKFVWITLDGPTRASEVISAQLVLGGNSPRLRGRLVREDHSPIASTWIGTSLRSRRPNSAGIYCGDPFYFEPDDCPAPFFTDLDGRFEVDVDLGERDFPEPFWILTQRNNQPDALATCIELSRLTSPGLHDLGEVALEPPPLIATGRVVDTAGRPIPGARIRVKSEWGVPNVHTTSDAEGRFELRSAEPFDRIDVDILKEGYAYGGLTPFAPGYSNLKLTLFAKSGIELRVLMPEGIPAFGTEISAVMEDTVGNAAGREAHGVITTAGTWRSDRLDPGNYSVRLSRDEELLWERSGIAVDAERITDLGTIDLRERVRRIRVRLVDGSGAPIPEGVYRTGASGTISSLSIWEADDPRGFNRASEFHWGTIATVTTAEHTDVIVYAKGRRFGILRDARDGQELRLEPGIEVAVAVRKPLGPLPTGKTLRLRLHRQWPRTLPTLANDVQLVSYVGEDGLATFLAPEAAHYFVEWQLFPNERSGTFDETSGISEIDVRDLTTPQRFELAVPAGLLESR